METPLHFHKALIVGATGMIGTHALLACRRRGIEVRTIIRPESNRRNLCDLAVEELPGSLEDNELLQAALRGCDLLIHAAAPYPAKHFGKAKLLASARFGLENLLGAARSPAGAGLKRFVYVSSVTTIGFPGGKDGRPAPGSRAAVETDTEFPIRDSAPYFELKSMMENMAIEASAQGLPVVVVNPTFCVDEFDAHQTTAQLMVPLAKGQIPAYIPGKVNAVATADVGEGICLAAERGRCGSRYILGGENMTSAAFMGLCAREAGVAAPRLVFPIAVAEAISFVTECLAFATGGRPLFPMTGIRMMKRSQTFEITRAREELGYQPGSVTEAIARAYRWYRKEGLI